MPSLINSSELAQIQGAFKDLRDTFLSSGITYHKVQERLDRFMEDTIVPFEQIYVLPALWVEDRSVKGSEVDIQRIGKYYPKTYYALLYWQDLVEAGLTDGDVPLINADKDYAEVDGSRYELTGFVKVPELAGEHSFIKLMFRSNIRPIA
jgi:hypothetical protein